MLWLAAGIGVPKCPLSDLPHKSYRTRIFSLTRFDLQIFGSELGRKTVAKGLTAAKKHQSFAARD